MEKACLLLFGLLKGWDGARWDMVMVTRRLDGFYDVMT